MITKARSSSGNKLFLRLMGDLSLWFRSPLEARCRPFYRGPRQLEHLPSQSL